jgi:hypothetical protein
MSQYCKNYSYVYNTQHDAKIIDCTGVSESRFSPHSLIYSVCGDIVKSDCSLVSFKL